MKKKLSLLMVALVALAAFAIKVTNRAAEAVTWDFSEFTEQIDLIGDNYQMEYNGLLLVGNKDQADVNKEFVKSGAGFHMNGASSSTRRYIQYSPTVNGKLTVSYRSNNNTATDRITAIGTAVTTFATVDAAPETVLACGLTNGSTVQSISADLTAGTTYYAYFAAGGQSIMSLEFTPEEESGAKEVQNVAALNALADGAQFVFNGTATVQALLKKGNYTYCYIKDETGSSLIYDKASTLTTNLAAGKKIAAGWAGTVSIYNNLFEVVPDAELTATEDAAVEPTFDEVTLADVTAANVNKIVKLTDVTIASVSGSNFNIKKGDATVVGYNQFSVEGLANGLVCSEMIGVISIYKETIQFQPISFTVGTPAPEPADVVLTLETGADITAAIAEATALCAAKNITINLAAGGSYTVSASIEVPAGLTINGNGATIDASALTVPVIKMSTTPSVSTNEKEAYLSDGIIVKDLKVTGVKYQFIYGNKMKYLLAKVEVDNSVIAIDGTAKKTVFDFNGGGNASEIIINNSTLWANPSNEQNGGLHSSQSGHGSIQDLGSEKQLFAITNSTIYNIAYGKTTNTQRRNNTAGMEFKVENSIIANSGKSGQFIVGLNGGSANAAQTYTINNNIFNFDAADVSAAEQTKVQEKIADKELNSIAGVVTFTDAANGDFNGTFVLAEGATSAPATLPGDPRWTVKYPASDIVVNAENITDGDITAALTAATFGKTAQNITINLAENGAYTVSNSIEVPAGLTINGNGATIDASALTVPVIKMSTTPSVSTNEKDAYLSDGIIVKDLKVTGVKYQFIYGNKMKYLLAKVEVDNSVIAIDGTNKKTIFDFNGGGNASEIIINKSTLWANPSNAQNGGLFSSQSGHGSIQDLGSEKQLFAITNSTIYNIAYGKTTNTQRRNNTAGMEFKVENSIIANSGKSGQFIVGLNGGSANAAQTYTINNNIFNFDAADVSAAEQTKVQEKIADKELNSIAGVVTFTDAANGDFGGTFTLASGATEPTSKPGDPRWAVEYCEPALWSSAEPVAVSWGSTLDIPVENTANIQVGDVIHVAVEGVTAGDAWSAQVALYDQQWNQLENGVPVGTGTVTDAAFVVTGDMLALIKANGLKLSGAGYSTKKVTLESGVYTGSENSIWLGDATLTWTQASVTKFHFINTNVAAGQIIKLTYEATGNPNIQLRYGWGDTDVYGDPTYGEGFATLEVSAEAVDILKDKGLIINADGIRLTQMELLTAPAPEPKFYIIGLNGWDRDNMIEMTRNETGRFEYEFAPTATTYFAFADYQMTAEEAAADADWSVFNSTYRYSLGAGNVDATSILGSITSLVKGVEGTIVLPAGTYKIVVEPDFNAVTITGEVAPPPAEDTYVVAGNIEAIFGTAWSATAEANKMEKNAETGLYEKKYEGVALEKTTIQYKIVKNGDSWIPDGNNKTIAIDAAGTYDVVFTFNAETSEITGVATLVTGISTVKANTLDNAVIYTLQGVRVDNANVKSGLYIVNGKKTVIK